MASYVLRIVCRAKSHEGKEVLTGRLQSNDRDGGTASGSTVLIDDKPVEARKVFGGANSPPDWDMSAKFREFGRMRAEFECDLCGVRAELTATTATTLMRGLIAAGNWTEREYRPDDVGDESAPLILRESSMNLEALAATM